MVGRGDFPSSKPEKHPWAQRADGWRSWQKPKDRKNKAPGVKKLIHAHEDWSQASVTDYASWYGGIPELETARITIKQGFKNLIRRYFRSVG